MSSVTELHLDYQVDGRNFRGTLYYAPEAARSQRLVLMIANFRGNTPANLQQARQIAEQHGHALFAVDLFGREALPESAEAAVAAMRALYADRPALRARIVAAAQRVIAAIAERKLAIETRRHCAIGFCFGGAAVLEYARSGADVAAVVSLHGTPWLEGPARNSPIKARVLVLHGDADPTIPASAVAAFENEMREGEVDWQLTRYGGAVHSFTDPSANLPGRAMYEPKVARRAFAQMRDFIDEAFADAQADR
jgi:dienelactone hydrolase